jgi:hypothetical protein
MQDGDAETAVWVDIGVVEGLEKSEICGGKRVSKLPGKT